MADKLFGTDGIRGRANQYPLTSEMSVKIGKSLAVVFRNSINGAVIIGKDTRESGDMIEAALASGIASQGLNVLLTGTIPTPGVAYLASVVDDTAAGVMISASHNPYHDNGIKIFNGKGEKISADHQKKVEAHIGSGSASWNGEVGRIQPLYNACDMYAGFLKKNVVLKLPHGVVKIVVDCSNGAAYEVAQKVFSGYNFDCSYIFCSPDGKNINRECGSQHTETLSARVREASADIGLAFDGDADRLIAVDEKGAVVTGDKILAICAKHLKKRGELANNTVVSTVMSNIGLSKCLEKLNIRHIKTDVGDRYVRASMLENGASIGGEDSGHTIFSEHHTTGDGILTALKLIEIMVETESSLSELSSIVTLYPQVLKNVEVGSINLDFMGIDEIANEIERVERELASEGRVLVRYSGTQPLLRVMIEGPDDRLIEEQCNRICSAIKRTLVSS